MAFIDWTYKVTNSVTAAALEGVNVWASSDIGGQTVIDSGTTDSSGEVTLSLEADTDYYLWHSFSGYTADDNPNLQTVTEGVDGSGTMTAIVAPVPDAVVLSDTVLDLISDALTECGILGQGETALAEDSQFALRRLNNMLDALKTQKLLVYKTDIDRHTLTADQQIHTIGPSGDFLAERPVRITKANIVVTSDDDDDEEIRYPINIIESANEWAQVTSQELTASVPTHLYCDYAHPDASLYLWPVPSVAYDLELHSWIQFSKFKTLTDKVDLPPGYYDFIMLSLAEKLCTPYGVPQSTRAQISADASLARAKVQGVNYRAPRIAHDIGIPNIEAL